MYLFYSEALFNTKSDFHVTQSRIYLIQTEIIRLTCKTYFYLGSKHVEKGTGRKLEELIHCDKKNILSMLNSSNHLNLYMYQTLFTGLNDLALLKEKHS
jgi:hypothetical protein